MNTCMGPGDVEVMKACLQILNAEDDDDPSKENALEVLAEKAEDIDSAKAGLLGKERGSKLKVKALFMMRNMCVDDKSVKNLLFEKGMIEELIHLLVVSPSADELSEHVIGTLVAIAEGHDKCMSICRKPELGLLECLQKRTEELTGNEAFQEERESSACLLKLCFDKDTK
eukprot:m.77415 g.77415  ORF g.77415 m.77415 type:complete len:171 (+) comp36031_c0_seq1:280-792(+)